MFRPFLLALLTSAALASAAAAGDCHYGTSRRTDCASCQQGHCRHHHCCCEPPPTGPVVASFPAFPVATFPLNAPASYTLNLAPPSQASIDELQRALDAARARAPLSCNGSKSPLQSPSQAPLAAPRAPADGVEGRVEQLETDMRSLEKSVRELIDLVKAREK